jgi:hypothetical protein
MSKADVRQKQAFTSLFSEVEMRRFLSRGNFPLYAPAINNQKS